MSAFVNRLTIPDGVAYAGHYGIEIPEVYQEKPSQELYINLMKRSQSLGPWQGRMDG